MPLLPRSAVLSPKPRKSRFRFDRASRLTSLLAPALAPLTAFAGIVAESPVTITPRQSLQPMRSDVAIQANGNFVVVWERHTDDNSGNVLMRRFATDGTPLGKAMLLTSAPGFQGEPVVAIGNDGGFLVAWSGAGAEDPHGVHARLFAADGSPTTGPFLVHEATPLAGEGEPSVTKDGDGYAVAHSGGRVVRLDANGNARGGFSPPTGDYNLVQIRDLPDSKLAMVWSSTRDVSLSNDSEGPVRRVDGVVLSSSSEIVEEFRANDPRPRTSYDYIVDGEQRLSLATSADGSFAVAHDSAIPRYLYNVDDHDGPYPLGAKVELFDPSISSFVGYYVADVPPEGLVADVARTPGGNTAVSVETGRIALRAIDCHGIIPGDGLVHVSPDGVAASGSSIAINERGDGVVVWSEEHGGDYSLAGRTFQWSDGCELCGDADESGRVTATDALIVLRAAISSVACPVDRCDTDGSSSVGADDALRVLRTAVSVATSAMSCSAAPVIELTDSTNSSAVSLGLVRSFALVDEGGGATLAWSGTDAGDGQTLLRHVSAGLELEPIKLAGGPDTWTWHHDTTGCGSEQGPALSWAVERQAYTAGITLDMSTVKVLLPGESAVSAHPDSVGEHRFGAMACLADGRYAVSWRSRCGAIRRESLAEEPEYFRPDECDDAPADGAHVRVVEADGSPITGVESIVLDDRFFQETALAAAGDDRFVAAAGPVLQVRSNDGELLSETTADVRSDEVSLDCRTGVCVRMDQGSALVFDPADLESLREFTVQPTMQVGPEREITPASAKVACEAGGVCVLAWVAEDLTVAAPGVFMRPFDPVSGAVGEAIRLPAVEPYTNSITITAVAPGIFVAAVDAYYSFDLHRIEVR